MASSARSLDTQMVMCHECEEEWYRQEHGLICPQCRSEFVEILEDMPRQDSLPRQEHIPRQQLQHPMPGGFQNMGAAHNIRMDQSPFGGYSISGTFVTGSPQPNEGQDFTNNFMQMLAAMIQGPTQTQTPPAPQNLMNTLFGQPQRNPLHANQRQNHAHIEDNNPLANIMGYLFAGVGAPIGNMGDYLHTQEDFDRAVSEFMEQHQSSTAAPPASEEIIASLPRIPLTANMVGDGTGQEVATKGECSICMDEVQVGNEVAKLPCDHWFHMECIRVWLQEHDTCPHCRKSVEEGKREAEERAAATSTQPSSRQSPVRRSASTLSNIFRRRQT
ncbi:hypothetical protein Vi05172_g8881 [Venturia inaequalis]|uniref:RING-type E3 ubiquitin transferase n=2 Tax=Venturia inaequalis TaxID=5025 RepID=A0A8H3VU25_VENIN|nr:hypothetical protein EG327_003057 [Venturia inaequalis]RDI80983.1 hypothetical protein Vi05172_g8881 [Venturia inaequalis]